MSSNINQSLDSKISEASERKQQGNDYFKNGNIQKAIKNYHFALLYIKDLEKDSPLGQLTDAAIKPKLDGKVKDSILALRNQCNNNLAACFVKKKEYEKVVKYTSMVLAVEQDNIKALFRRGESYMLLKDIDNAEKDFKSILKYKPDDTSINKYIRQIGELQKQHLHNEKEIYKRMMNNGT